MSEIIVKISELHEFKGNPYNVRDDEEMEELTESIKQYGIIEPLIVRERKEGGYEIISGHRRKYACEKAGIEQVPVFIREMDKNMAIITLVDSNLQRKNILPSERAFAYKMKLEAEKHQGKTCGHDVHKSRDNIAEDISGRQIQRYIRLTELIKPLLQLVDENKMAMTPAVEISYLKEQEQKDLLETIQSEECTPSYSQAIRMKELSKQNMLGMDTIFSIMTEQKPNQREQIKFKVDKLKDYFPKGYTSSQMQDIIEKLLKQYKQKWKNKELTR
ncbi:MAG: ParB/RepB/Spo0J family partition protein [Clostridia bacterium]|nr:ParB/RepB/Spo0J family partition protein [Clostridia bacterium]